MGEHREESFKAILVKPQTFMNNSGQAARSIYNFYKPPLSQLMVIFDDLDLPFGTIRIRRDGGSSGQKGMKSIIDHLGTEDFPRMRVGIGRPPGKMDSVNFILNKFKPSEQEDLNIILNYCADAVEIFIKDGIEKAMTTFNKNILDGES
jgi:PTH1 family peptidyl-tRNA hydrolase